MSSFGEKLKHERVSRNTSIEEIAGKSKIELRYLEALEQNEFDALPGQAFGKFYIRVYAEVLGFDPEPLIEEYDREQQRRRQAQARPAQPEPVRPRRVEAALARWREARWAERERQPDAQPLGPPAAGTAPEAAAEVATGERVDIVTERASEEPAVERFAPDDKAEAEPVTPAGRPWIEGGHDEAAAIASVFGAAGPDVTARSRRGHPLLLVLLCGAVLTAIWIIFFVVRGSTGESDAPEGPRHVEPTTQSAPVPAPPRDEPARANGRDDKQTTPAADRVAGRTEPTGAKPRPAGGGALTVTELGVGLRVVNRRLEGQGRSFVEGSVVSFLTRVLGGQRGQTIRHVWLFDGRTVQNMELELGGPHWRTHSSKTLWGVGEWAAEVRDADNRVLARTTFTCVSR